MMQMDRARDFQAKQTKQKKRKPCPLCKRVDIFSICNSYESGVGHGHKQDNVCNPYDLGTYDWKAWDVGYKEGVEQACDTARAEEMQDDR